MRVIAGELGGRRLVAPRGRGTRPTSDRVREAIFAALGDVVGLRVLDLYAGTGSLGIEALSRGAREAVFVERSPAALRALRTNLHELELSARARVVACEVGRVASRLEGAFDLVVVDPPYAQVAEGTINSVIASLMPRLAGARIVLEHASRDEPPAIEQAQIERRRRYGDTSTTFYRALGST